MLKYVIFFIISQEVNVLMMEEETTINSESTQLIGGPQICAEHTEQGNAVNALEEAHKKKVDPVESAKFTGDRQQITEVRLFTISTREKVTVIRATFIY